MQGCAARWRRHARGHDVTHGARHERNDFAEAWENLTGSGFSIGLQNTGQAAYAVASDATVVRKCVVNGKLIYTNVECSSGNPATRTVELQDTKGFAPPKQAPLKPVGAASGSIEAALEKVIRD